MNAYDSPEDKTIAELKDRIAELEKENSELKYEKSSGVYATPQIKEVTDDELKKVFGNSINGDWCDGFTDGVRWLEKKLKKASKK